MLASYGHVRDLVPKEGAVDPEHDFAMKYQPIEKNLRHVEAIAKAVAKADTLYLATDPDREGEAISWHLHEILRQRDLLSDKPVQRVVFHEITQRAILDAINHPRQLSLDLVNAQQARRALDYLVGFNLSPLLWKKIRPGLSAGRVQSPALRMIVEREEKSSGSRPGNTGAWKPTPPKPASRSPPACWSMPARNDSVQYRRRCSGADPGTNPAGAAPNWPSPGTGGRSRRHRPVAGRQGGTQAAQAPSRRAVHHLDPAAGSLAQDGFLTQRTMRVAQQLYEGIDTGGGAVGLITYMRTDSVSLAQDALIGSAR